MKQPVVLQVLPRLHSGGVERGTIEVAGAISRAGWRSLVASEGGAMLASVAYVGAEHFNLPLANKNPFVMWRNAAKLEKIIRSHQVDIVHARSRAPAWSAWLASQRTGAAFVTTFHGAYGLQTKLKQRYNAVMAKGARVIAISHFIEQYIKANYTIDPSIIRIIHRGVDLNVFDPTRILPQRMVDLTSKWRLPEDVPLILLPARITRWKGHEVLIEALAKLPHRHFFCLLVGDESGHPGYRKELEDRVIARGLEGYVRMTGNTSHMTEAYMLADIVVVPSTEPEPFGRVPVEAQAMGRLVIASDHGGARETIIDGQTGWLVKPGDVGALCAAIAKALALPKAEKDRIGAQASEHVRTHFSADIMCAKTLEVYWELIKSRYE